MLIIISPLGYNIAKAPLYFVRSGIVSIYYGRLNSAGLSGYGWSASAGYYTSDTDARASFLYFDAAGVNPSLSHHRWAGLPLRCLQNTF